jgi:hypothetical protein
MAAKCRSTLGSVCDATWRKPLDVNGGGWRGDIIALDRKCLDYPDCGDVIGCHVAWTTAVGF